MGCLRGYPRSQLHEDPGKLKRIIEHMELEHLVKLRILLRLEHETNHYSLLRWLKRNVILKDTSEEFHQN
jgi:hypothetical protein